MTVFQLRKRMKRIILAGNSGGGSSIKPSYNTFLSSVAVMEYIVDILGFKQPVNDYVIKELAIIPVHGESEPLVFLFKPPYHWRRLTDKYKKENSWLTCSYHGLSWHGGNIPYTEVGNILRVCLKDASRIIVKGSINKKWLERFNFTVYDISEMGFPSVERVQYEKMLSICTHHDGAYKVTCAARNVKLLRNFYLKSIPMEID